MTPRLSLALGIVGALAAASCVLPGGAGVEREDARDVRGARYVLHARDADAARADAALVAAFAEIERVAGLLHPSEPGAEVALLNAVPSRVWIAVSETTARALRRAREIAEASDGYYEPTLGPVLRAWGLADGAPRVPPLAEINHALRKVGWADLEVREREDAARRAGRNVEVDLRELARGAVLDAALAAMREAGVPAAMAACGPDRAAYGGSARRPWWVAVAHPDTGAALTEIELRDGGLVVVAPRVLQVAGADAGALVPVHPQIDPWTGLPARGLRLVAVASADAASAGGFAAAVFAMGEQGPAFAEAHDEIEALVLRDSGEVARTPGLRARRTHAAAE